jgi:hypothetical protein
MNRPDAIARFRALACELPGAQESSHMGNPDFRVHGRIFATLSGQARGRAVLKLTPGQQAEFVAELPELFEPVQGGWGRMGMTYLVLERADDETTRGALLTAYRNVDAKAAARRPGKPTARRAPKRRTRDTA